MLPCVPFVHPVYNCTCIHGLTSVSFGIHPVLDSLALAAEKRSSNMLEAVNLSSVTVLTKYLPHADAENVNSFRIIIY